MDYGIKVAEPDFDVRTADDKNLSLKSGLTLLKVFDQDTITLSSTWTEITHNLGYVPHFLVYVLDTTEDPNRVYLATADLSTAVARADTTKLYIKKRDSNQTKAYYYIFYEPADTGTAPSVTATNSFGLKVSKDGVDVSEANILEQTFNSEKNSLKIALEGGHTSTASGYREVAIEHGLENIPGYFIFYEVDNSGKWYPMFADEDQSGKSVRVTAWAEEEEVIVGIQSTGSAAVKIKYYILVDPGEEPE